MIPMYHVHDYGHGEESPCFGCGKLTHFYVVEFEHFLCWDCIHTLTSVEVIASKKRERLIQRHERN